MYVLLTRSDIKMEVQDPDVQYNLLTHGPQYGGPLPVEASLHKQLPSPQQRPQEVHLQVPDHK